MSNHQANNPHLISTDEAARNADYPDAMSYLEAEGTDSIILACCDEGCQVEPDGYCEHGCPSIIVALGLI